LEHVRDALVKANASLDATASSPRVTRPSVVEVGPTKAPASWQPPAIQLKPRQMERARIVSYDMADEKHVAFNLLRTRVRGVLRERNWTSVAITSPTAHCGKTTVAINLAFSLARSPELRVVLVDLDLKKPNVAKTLGLEVTSSVGYYLRGNGPPEACFVSAAPNLTIALNRDRARDSSELLQSDRMNELLAFIRSRLKPDVILFDLPPMLPSDDAIAFLPKVDAALLVASAGITKVSEIQECEAQVSQMGKLLGVALNKSDVSEEAYY
jgi:protein-tyrosine kinase